MPASKRGSGRGVGGKSSILSVLPCRMHLVAAFTEPVPSFLSRRIRAGTELTWDYNYEVGSVEGKELLCCCGAIECRGRLL